MSGFEILLLIILGSIAFFHLLFTVALIILLGRGVRLLGYVEDRISQFEHALQGSRHHECSCCKQSDCPCCKPHGSCFSCHHEGETHTRQGWVDLAAQFTALAMAGMDMWKGYRHRRR